MQQRVVVVRARLDAQPAAVRHLLRGLGEHQAACRIGAIEAAAGQIVEQRFVIELGIIPAKRELESVLPLRRAVAGSRSATYFVQHRLHIANKADLRGLGQITDVDDQLCLLPAGGNRYFRIALADGMQQPVAAHFHHRLCGRELRGAGQVDVLAVRGGPGHEDVRPSSAERSVTSAGVTESAVMSFGASVRLATSGAVIKATQTQQRSRISFYLAACLISETINFAVTGGIL